MTTNIDCGLFGYLENIHYRNLPRINKIIQAMLGFINISGNKYRFNFV